jgi:hypothetical protein
MERERDKNHVSVGFWILSIVVMAIPLVNVIMTLIWAFTGENESRKNYFKAVIAVFLFFIGITVIFLTLGMLPSLLSRFR